MCHKIMLFLVSIYSINTKMVDNYYTLFILVFNIIFIGIFFTNLDVKVSFGLLVFFILFALPVSAYKWMKIEKNHTTNFFNFVCFGHVFTIVILLSSLIYLFLKFIKDYL